MTQQDLADRVGVTQSAILNLEKRDSESSRNAGGLALALGVRLEWLLSGKGQMREGGSLLPPDSNIAPGPSIKGRVPLISWVQAGNWTEVVDVFQPEDAEDWVVSAFNHSDLAFALRVRGISMEPEFREGEIIIVDPTRSADSGRFVVAKKVGTSETTFKQLIQDGTEYYLKALNPDWPEKIIRMDEEWVVSGVVIGKTKAY